MFGMHPGNMPSVILTHGQHVPFTNKWMREISYGVGTDTATRASVLMSAEKIYASNPDWLRAIAHFSP
jgi:hypothetical protein